MNLIRITKLLSTLGPIGYFGASGTVATIVTLPLVYWSHAFIENQQLYFGFLFGMFVISISIVRYALKQFKRHEDPSEIVLDEVLGCLITFWGISLTSQSVLVGFLLFRALDIIKFGWVKQAESFADAWGVIGDDVVAALIANGILRLLF
ncbi:MAG: Phosphatidylglycerophosphatase A [uncultured bacterium]|nr:MAG: Phosphatidylglycerophosphatase A [uncultured bacterium]